MPYRTGFMHFDNKMSPDGFLRVRFQLYKTRSGDNYVKAAFAEPLTSNFMWHDIYKFERCGLTKPKATADKSHPGKQTGWIRVDAGCGMEYFSWNKNKPMTYNVLWLCNKKAAAVPMEIDKTKNLSKRTNRCRSPISQGLLFTTIY